MAQIIRTHCSRMDHGGCTLKVEVENDRIVKIHPDSEGPLNQGFFCAKAKAVPEMLGHPERLTRPLKRIGERGSGRWEEISWTEAMVLASERLLQVRDRYGARSVAFCQGSPKGLEHFALIRLANTFGSPNVVGPQNVCHMPREIAAIQTCGFYPTPDFDSLTETMLVWGSNVTSTNEEGVISSRLLRSRAHSGCNLVVVDPRRTVLAKEADIWLPVRPGGDLALALAFLNVVINEDLYDHDFVDTYTFGFDQLARHVQDYAPQKVAGLTGVEAEVIVEAARLYAEVKPALIQWGNGFEQNVQGFDTARALVCLMSVCGNLDSPGGNIQALAPPVMKLGQFVRADLAPNRSRDMISAGQVAAPQFVIVPPELFKKAVLEETPYPVKAAYVQVSNPVLAWSDSRSTVKALKQLDFLVVTETFMSPTAALADLVLPAATTFEYDDLGHYGLAHGYILARPKAVEPPPECWSNLKILNHLAWALDLGEQWWDKPEEVLDDVLAPAGLSFSDLIRKGILRGKSGYFKYRDRGFKTPTGKVELQLSKALQTGLPALPKYVEPPEPEDPDFPLILSSHKSSHFFGSDHRRIKSLLKFEPEAVVDIHPDDAVQFAVNHDEPVQIQTRFGQVTAKARVTPDIRPGVISLVHGWWRPELGPENPASYDQSSFNILTSSRRLGLALGTPNLRAIPARLAKPTPAGSKTID